MPSSLYSVSVLSAGRSLTARLSDVFFIVSIPLILYAAWAYLHNIRAFGIVGFSFRQWYRLFRDRSGQEKKTTYYDHLCRDERSQWNVTPSLVGGAVLMLASVLLALL